jgi:BNR repeat-like domain
MFSACCKSLVGYTWSVKILLWSLCALTAAAASFDGRQPQLASRDGLTGLTFGAGNAIYFASSADGGKKWSQAVKVAEDGVLSLGSHRGPRIAIGSGVIVISAAAGAKGRGQDGDLRTWRSLNGGKTWTAGPQVNDVPASAREGLHAMAAGPGNRLIAVWLDDREGRKALYGATSEDGGVSWKNERLYRPGKGSVCECCHPNVIFGPNGHIYAMFRNSLEGSRDLYLLTSANGGRSFSPQKLGEGTWKLDACPMDGGSLVLDGVGIRTVWRRGDTVYEARPGKPEREIAKGKNPAAAGSWTAWTSGDDLYVANSGGVARKRTGAYPALVDAGAGRAVIAYEAEGRIVTDRLE